MLRCRFQHGERARACDVHFRGRVHGADAVAANLHLVSEDTRASIEGNTSDVPTHVRGCEVRFGWEHTGLVLRGPPLRDPRAEQAWLRFL